jgi:hypothetical protein
MRLDTDALYVREYTLTVEQIRDYIGGEREITDKIENWFDEAQGDIAAVKFEKIYLVIEVIR